MPQCYTMCATTFGRSGEFDEKAFRLYLHRQIRAGLGLYLGSGGNGESHAMSPAELSRLYAVGVEECKGKVPIHANLPEEHTAEATIAQARIAIRAGVEAVHLYTLEGRHGFIPTDRELAAYFDDVLSAVRHPVVIAVNPTMGYIPEPPIIAEICNRHADIVGIRLSGVREIYMITLQDMVRRPMTYHWQFGSAALDPLALGAELFAAEANIIPATVALFRDLYEQRRFDELGEVLAHIRRFNKFVMRWGPCARWIKMAMHVLKLPGWEGGLRRPYLMPPEPELQQFAHGLLALRIPEITNLAEPLRLAIPPQQ